MEQGSPEVADAPEHSRYEARVDGILAGVAEYRDHGDERAFTHTEVTLEGRGVGGALARTALDDVRVHRRLDPAASRLRGPCARGAPEAAGGAPLRRAAALPAGLAAAGAALP